jgi:hypothetical protein
MATHEIATTTQQNRHKNNTLLTFTELPYMIFALLHSPQQIQCVPSWRDVGFKLPTDFSNSELTDNKMVKFYDICGWDADAW